MSWLKVALFSALLYGLLLMYSSFYASALGFTQFSESLAGTGGFLIGISFALSGMTYFFDFLDKELHYRKQLGVTGYFFALAYSVTLLIRFPAKYDISRPMTFLTAEACFGLVAMVILTAMAFASLNVAVKLLGPVLWRKVLRSGYFAYLLLIVRAYLVEGEMWSNWLILHNSLPPARLLLTIFACYVLALRFCMEVSLRVHKKNPVSPSGVSTVSSAIATPAPVAPPVPVTPPTSIAEQMFVPQPLSSTEVPGNNPRLPA